MNPVVYLSRKLWEYSHGNRKSVVLYVSLFICVNLIRFFEPLVIAWLLDTVQTQGVTTMSFPTILGYLALLPTITFTFWFLHGPARIIENRNAFLARANFKHHLLNETLSFPMEWHSNHHSGDTIDKIEKGSTALYRFSADTFQVIEVVIFLISSYIALIYFNPHSAYIVLVLIALTVVLVLSFDKVLIGQYAQLYKIENTISAKVFDVISNITTVIILRIEKLVTSSIMVKVMQPLPLFMKNNRINEVKWFLVSVCGVTMTVLVMGTYLYTHLLAGSVIMIGTLYALYGYVGRIGELFFRFAYMYGDIVQQKASVQNAEELLNLTSVHLKAEVQGFAARWQEIKLANLQFAYEIQEDEKRHLDHVSMLIKRGARIALIGASGSGKTTFLKILRELYPLQSGEIYLDNKLEPLGIQSISSEIALIPQDPEIFSTTIRENLTVGIEHSDDYIRHFTDMACFTEVLERLPHGLESLIYEKGVNLSGGERQRLALARGLMASQDKSILLLDESTSSVDTKNELAIFQNIFTKFADKTIIASIHRLHLLAQFDEIHFFKQGKIVASGSLAELLKDSEEFKELWDKYHKAHLNQKSEIRIQN